MFHNRRRLISAAQRPFVAAGGGGAWTPASVTTDFWFDASNAASITASSGAVSQWNDLSGNGRHATQSSGSFKFTDTASAQNGKHGLLSVNANGTYMVTSAFSRTQPFMIFAAVKTNLPTPGSGYLNIMNGATTSSGNRPVVYAAGDGSVPGIQAGGTYLAATSGGPQLGLPYYFTSVFTGGSSIMRENGVQIASGPVGATGLSGLVIASDSGGGEAYDGYFLELFCIPGTSPTDITNAEAYLAAKWGIGWTPHTASAAFWFDADNVLTLTKDGSNFVSIWRDISGNNRSVSQGGAGFQFTYTTGVQNGRAGLLSVAASQQVMNMAGFTLTQPFIIACAVKTTTNPLAKSLLWDMNNAGVGLVATFGDGTTDSGISSASNTVRGGGTLANNTPYYLVGVYDGTSSKYRKNGVAIAGPSNIGSTGLTGAMSIGCYPDAFAGYFLEIFLLPGSSTTDIANAETYLAAKWAI